MGRSSDPLDGTDVNGREQAGVPEGSGLVPLVGRPTEEKGLLSNLVDDSEE